MKPGPLILSGELELPPEAVTETFGLLAVRRAGKSSAARVLAEEFFRERLHFVAIDPVGSWYGLRSSKDGKSPGLPIPIFGGRHGDVPLEQTGGVLIADLVVNERLSCVLDVSQFESESAKKRFLLDFARRLYLKNQDPLHVFLEEADDYIPQRPQHDDAQLLRAWENIVRRGGQRGIGCTLITQRSASLNKSVLTQVQTLIVLRTTGPQDRAAIGLWVERNALETEILDSLPGLQDGEAWVWSPNFLRITKRFRFRLPTTFDSGATPKVGATRKATTLADVDLAAVKKQMAATIDRAKATDPKALLARVAELERQLRDRPHVTKVATAVNVEPKIVKVPVAAPIRPAQLRALERILKGYERQNDRLDHVNHAMQMHWQSFGQTAESMRAMLRPDPANQPEPTRNNSKQLESGRIPVARSDSAAPQMPPRIPRASPGKLVVDGEGNIGAGPRRMLEVLAAFAGYGLTKNQLGVLSIYPATGSTFRTYVPILKRSGLVEESGDRLGATAAGLKLVGEQTPPQFDEVLVAWRARLGAGEVRMLDVLVDAHPQRVTREALGEHSGYEYTGSTFRTYLPKLRRKGLVEYDASEVWMNADVYFGAGAQS